MTVHMEKPCDSFRDLDWCIKAQISTASFGQTGTRSTNAAKAVA
jgi:hypothetical protein